MVGGGLGSPGPDVATAFPVVVLVSSAAASETLARVLAPLPSDFPGAVLAMHAGPPDTEREQARVLGQRIALPVTLARAGSVLRPGNVLLLPSGRQPLLGADQRVRLVDVYSVPSDRPPVGQVPSPDLLLHTLAVALGPRAIAVLLSGGRQPGTLGAQAVRGYGGRSLVRGRPPALDGGRAAEVDGPPPPPLTLDAIASALLRLCNPQRPRGT
jgi:two-component system chemotaxis response regulator CheB